MGCVYCVFQVLYTCMCDVCVSNILLWVYMYMYIFYSCVLLCVCVLYVCFAGIFKLLAGILELQKLLLLFLLHTEGWFFQTKS